MKKQIVSLLLVAGVALAVSACSGKKQEAAPAEKAEVAAPAEVKAEAKEDAKCGEGAACAVVDSVSDAASVAK